ncbi:cache domain-containing protein [Arsukibacterium ikkense]|nr:cache domain-containing protein [Arsukibacterium ikkense]
MLFLLQVNSGMKHNQQQLAMFAQQIDAQVLPALQFAETIKQRAQQASVEDSNNTYELPLLSLTTSDLMVHQLTLSNDPLAYELQMLARLQPYFDIAPASLSLVKHLYYVSEQGFAYNGKPRWSDYIVEQLQVWLQRYGRKESSFDRNPVFYRDFMQEQAAMSVPLFINERRVGRFVLALELAPLLTNLAKNNPERHFLLLDQAGEIIASSRLIDADMLNQYQLQIQRLTGLPWSLAIIDKNGGAASIGMGKFFLYWLSYASVMLVLAWQIARRYKRKIVGPLQRLSVHVDRLATGQPGVSRIPDGWQGLFDRISQLKTDDKQKTD